MHSLYVDLRWRDGEETYVARWSGFEGMGLEGTV